MRGCTCNLPALRNSITAKAGTLALQKLQKEQLKVMLKDVGLQLHGRLLFFFFWVRQGMLRGFRIRRIKHLGVISATATIEHRSKLLGFLI